MQIHTPADLFAGLLPSPRTSHKCTTDHSNPTEYSKLADLGELWVVLADSLMKGLQSSV